MIFKDPELERSYLEKGFVKVSLLNERDISRLRDFAQSELHVKRPVIDFAESLGYYISNFDKDPVQKRKAFDIIVDVISPHIDGLLNDYECFYSNFMIKYPGDPILECHQDFNLVDETKFAAFNLWAPLQDTNEENGGLFILPGSHNIKNLYRGPNVPFSFTTYTSEIMGKCEAVEVKSGECLIFDHRTIHHSGPNKTQEIRFAVQSVLKPREADALLYRLVNDKVRGLKISSDYLIEEGYWSEKHTELPVLHERAYIDPLDYPEVKKLTSDHV